MKTTKSGFQVGATVAFNADLADMFPSCMNTIWTVVDCRLSPVFGYTYTLSEPNGSLENVSADDLREVGTPRA
jgi:hypothetical protein